MMKLTIVMAAALLVLGSCKQSQKQDKQVQKSETMNNTEDAYTFKLNDKVTRKKVTFKNRYGISVTADLCTPKNIENQKLAALVVSGPFGAVKEQSSGLYANQLASRGFVTLAFDPSFTGESGGEVRNVASLSTAKAPVI